MENHFLLESLAACHDSNSKLLMYFTVNTTFVNYLDHIDNLTESLEFQVLKSKTTFEETLPISLNISKFDSDLLTTLRNLKDFIHQCNCKKEIFGLDERHDTMDLTTNKNFFSNNYILDVFLSVTSVISLLVTNFAIYLLCKHKKVRMLVTSLALQQARELGNVTVQEEVTTECKIKIYIILVLTVTTYGLVMFAVLRPRKLKLCRGCMFSNAVKIMLFISDVQYYVPIKLCKTAGNIQLFKITGTIKPENVKLR